MGRFSNDPYGFVPECVHCDDAGCDRCCPTEPVTLADLDMMDALEADGEKLRALTGEDHGPFCPDCLGSGFSGFGTGYGDVCSTCGGQRTVNANSQ